MTKMQFEPYEPELGPPKPHECLDGFLSHTWQMAIEEGQVSLFTDCHLCSEGIWHWVTSDELALDAIPVLLTPHVEGQGSDGVYTWIELTPVT